MEIVREEPENGDFDHHFLQDHHKTSEDGDRFKK